jgi:hypothetical protein
MKIRSAYQEFKTKFILFVALLQTVNEIILKGKQHSPVKANAATKHLK